MNVKDDDRIKRRYVQCSDLIVTYERSNDMRLDVDINIRYGVELIVDINIRDSGRPKQRYM